MLMCEGVNVTYARVRAGKVLDNVAVDVQPGEPVAIMGPSGSGKSTLLRILSGVQRPDNGIVTLDGSPMYVGRASGLHPRVAFVHQDFRLIEFLTCLENLQLAAELRGRREEHGKFTEALSTVGLAGFDDRMPPNLSGGEQQRVAIARAIVTGCDVLLADEPTGALDRDNSLSIAELLRELAVGRGLMVAVATHDDIVADRMLRCLHLRSGVLEDATPSA